MEKQSTPSGVEKNIFEKKAGNLTLEEKLDLYNAILPPKGNDFAVSSESLGKVHKNINLGDYKNQKIGLFEYLVVLFLNIFFGVSVKQYKTHKSIKKIYEKLNKRTPNIYNLDTNKMKPEFANMLYNLYTDIVPIGRLLDQVIFNKQVWLNVDNHLSGIEIFYKNFISNDIDDLYQILNINSTERKLVLGESLDKVKQNYFNDVNNFFQKISYLDLQNAINVYKDFFFIYKFFTYNIESILCYFDSNFSFENTKKEDLNFQEYPAPILVGKIENIAEILYSITPSDSYDEHVTALYSICNYLREKGISRNELPSEDLLKHSFQNFTDKLKEIQNKNSLILLLRCLKNDPRYNIAVFQYNYPLEEDYKKVLLERAKFVIQNSESAMKNIILTEIKSEIFDDNFEEVGEYNTPNSEFLVSKHLIGLHYINTIATMSAFIKGYFYKNLMILYHIFSREAKFMDSAMKKDFQKMMQEAKIFADGFENYLATFSTSQNPVSMAVQNVTQGTMQPKEIILTLQDMENIIEKYIRKFKSLFGNLQIYITQIYQDLDSNAPGFITNLSTIGGNKNQQIKEMILEINNSTEKLLNYFDFLDE